MKLTNPTEHAIYAAAYTRVLHLTLAGDRPPSFSLDEWAVLAADLGIAAGERAVELHREAMRRRRAS